MSESTPPGRTELARVGPPPTWWRFAFASICLHAASVATRAEGWSLAHRLPRNGPALWAIFAAGTIMTRTVLVILASGPPAATGNATPPPASTCATAALRATGTIRYYCNCGTGSSGGCVNGSDANSGLTPALAKQNLTTATTGAFDRFNSMAGGDTIALCRTGAWPDPGQLVVNNSNCSQGGAGWPAPDANTTTCDFRDYIPSWGNSGSPRPVINAGTGTMFRWWSSPNLGKGFRFWNLELNVPSNQNGQGTWEADTPTGYIDICNVYWHDGDYAFNDQSGSLDSNGQGHFTIRNSDFRRAQDMAILWASDYLVADSNYFENNGLRNTPQMHDLYYQQNCPAGCIGGKVINNHSVSSTALPPTGDLCGGVRFVFHGNQNGLIIENNLVENSGGSNGNCYGIQSAHSAANAVHVNLQVRRNRVSNMPGTAIEMSCCQNCTISDNIVISGSIISNSDTACGAGTPGGATIQNNSINTGNVTLGTGGGGVGGAANYIDNNAFSSSGCSALGDNGASVIQGTGSNNIGRQSNNYCRSNASAMWVNPLTNFTPVNPGPLVGAANQTFYDTPAIGDVVWAAAEATVARTPPSPAVDIGAMQH